MIRPARPEDAAALGALEHATWSVDVTPAPPRPPDAAVFGAHRRPEDTLVALVGGRLVGYVTLAGVSPLASQRHVLEVRGLAVDPARRRQGLGRALLAAACEEARRRGVRRLSLRVLGPNTPAQTLYAEAGFSVEGVLCGEFLLDGRYVDDVLMALELSAGS
jgi:ribosomal protein S18 acetylase RimI-like enzyme